MSTYRSFAEQSAHYFNRPHDEIPDRPIEGAAAWSGGELADQDRWLYWLSQSQVEEIEAALRRAIATGRPTVELGRDDFPLPSLAKEIASWREELDTGRGFLVVKGLPIDRWPEEHCELFFWCFGLHLGSPGAQNAQGDLLGHVTDTGEATQDPYVRRYRTSAHIAYHCDAADVVGLLCLRKAKRGGLSRIASSITVYNEMLRRRPDLVERLYEPFLLDVRNEDADGAIRHVPVPPCRFADGRLRTFYHSDYFRSVVRHDDVPPLTETERTLLDLYEEIASESDLCLDMDLEPGTIQLLSNHTILHARTRYDDHAEPERKRHLLRLWLSIK